MSVPEALGRTSRPEALVSALERAGIQIPSSMDGTHAAGEPRVHLVGYGPSASTIGANRAGQAAARHLRRLLHPAGERAA